MEREGTVARQNRLIGGERRPHTTLYLTDTDLATLRALAAALGYFTRRGRYAKRWGSVTGLASAIAGADASDHTRTVAILHALLRPID